MNLRRLMLPVLALAVAVGTTGCNKYGYDATIEKVDVTPGYRWINVNGWVHDPFLSKRSGCAWVYVTFDRVQLPGGSSCIDGKYVVDAADPDPSKGAGFRFSALTGGQRAGTYEACVFAVATGAKLDAPALACEPVVVPFDLFDHSALDTATVSGGVLTADGWYSKVTMTLSDSMNQVAWFVDGVVVNRSASGVTVTKVDRPDAVAAVGPTAEGLHLSTPITPGRHEVCIALVASFDQRRTDGSCTTVVAP